MKIALGILSVIVGVALLVITVKYPEGKMDPIATDYRGYLAGLGFIALGAALLYDGI